MVGDARLLLLLPLETTKVAPDNTVVLMLKPGNQTSPMTPKAEWAIDSKARRARGL